MCLTNKFGAAIYDLMMRLPEAGGLQGVRRRLLAEAQGVVLEIGAGTGANLANYPAHIEKLYALEPSSAMAARMDLERFSGAGDVEVLEALVGEIPLADHSVDTVVTTLVLCSVPDVAEGLAELRRVLKPQGQLLFLEHVASPEPKLRRWQDRVDPIWYGLNGDCHLNRRTAEAIEAAHFQIVECERDRMPRAPSVLAPMIRGIAVPKP